MNQPSSRNRRDREATKRRLVDTTIALIRESGFEQVGINAIAERAGVSKVLIYRYFTDLAGLLRAVADRLDPLQAAEADRLMASLEADQRPGAIMEQVVLKLHDALKEDELTKQLMVRELTRQSEVTEVLSTAREEVGLRLTAELTRVLRDRDLSEAVDVNALVAIVNAAITYLTLRADAVAEYNGVDVGSPGGWERLAATVRLLVDAVTSGRTDV